MSGDPLTKTHRGCPNGRSRNVRRSHTHGALDKLPFWFLRSRPYRCQDCDERYHSRSQEQQRSVAK
jgi:hypothetical protein